MDPSNGFSAANVETCGDGTKGAKIEDFFVVDEESGCGDPRPVVVFRERTCTYCVVCSHLP